MGSKGASGINRLNSIFKISGNKKLLLREISAAICMIHLHDNHLSLWLPSQNGLLYDFTQRQSVTLFLIS